MIWLLLVLYQVKHFTCDFPLQTPWMLGKFKGGYAWILPLLAHAGVHGIATFLIALCIKPKSAFLFALFDTVIHFTMDRIKASPNLLGRYKALSANEYGVALRVSQYDAVLPETVLTVNLAKNQLKSNQYFWWALGLDQGVHHLTHYAIIWGLLS